MTRPSGRARRAAALTGWLLAVGWTAPAADAAAEEIVRLSAVTPAPAVLVGGARPATIQLRFDLPAGAAQGPRSWYLVRLRYRLRFARNSGDGFAWVTSDTNERTAAQIEYTTRRRRGGLSVRRTTVDLKHGQRERRSRSRRDALTFTNYLQYKGVRPGANTWTIRLEQAGSTRVDRLEVLGDSAILRTDRTPFPLTVSAALSGDPPRVGERFTVNATLAARQGRSVGDVVLRVQTREGDGVRLLGRAVRRLGRVSGRRRTVPLRFVAERAGSYGLTLAASSDANAPNVGVQVDVLPATTADSTSATVWTLTSIPALGMVAWLVVSRRRRRERADA